MWDVQSFLIYANIALHTLTHNNIQLHIQTYIDLHILIYYSTYTHYVSVHHNTSKNNIETMYLMQ